MTKDRLAALRGAYSDDEDDDDQAMMNEVAINMMGGAKDSAMQELFAEVEDIRQMIDAIQANVDRVKMKHSDILSTPQVDQNLCMELEDLMADIKRTSNQVRAKLKNIEHSIDQDDPNGDRASSADLRIRKTQHATLSRKFVDIMFEYNRAQTDHRERCKARMQRQLDIAGCTTTNQELEDMLEQRDSTIFTRGIVMHSSQAKQTYADIEARHANILKLENSIRELHDMFMDMALLVESQGELIDRVEYHVAQTTDYVGLGKEGLGVAQRYKRKSRKKLAYIALCLLIVLAIFLALLFC